MVWENTNFTSDAWAYPPAPTPAVKPPEPVPELEPRARPDREQMAAGPRGVILPWFLPYFDNEQSLGENAATRRAYRRMCADPHVKASLFGKVLSVAASELSIQPASESSERSKAKAEFIDWTIKRRCQGGLPELAWSILAHGGIDGYSISEKCWTIEGKGKWRSKEVLKAVKPKDTGRDCVLETDEYRNVVAVKGIRYNAGEEYDPRDFILFRHLPLYNNPTGMSDLRAAYRAYWLLDTAWKLRGIGLEKRALVMLLGHYQNAAQKPGLEQALEDAKWSTWIAAPENCKVEAIDLAGQSDEIFKSTIEDLRQDIVIGITGAFLQLMTGGAGEERGNSQVHKDSADLFKWHLSACLAAILNDRENGLIRELIDRNFADDGSEEDYPLATFGGIDEGELAESLKIDMGLRSLVDLSRQDIYQRYGRKRPADDADRIPAAAATSPAGGDLGAEPFADAISIQTAPVRSFDRAGLTEPPPSRQNLQRFAERTAAKWNAAEQAGRRVPEKAISRADRRLRGSGWLLVWDRGQWTTQPAKDFNYKRYAEQFGQAA